MRVRACVCGERVSGDSTTAALGRKLTPLRFVVEFVKYPVCVSLLRLCVCACVLVRWKSGEGSNEGETRC